MKIIIFKAISMAKVDFDHTNAEQILKRLPSPPFVGFLSFFFFFFLLINFFSEGWNPPPPLTKIPGSAPGDFFLIV